MVLQREIPPIEPLNITFLYAKSYVTYRVEYLVLFPDALRSPCGLFRFTRGGFALK